LPEIISEKYSDIRVFTVAVLLATFRPNLDFLDQQIKSIVGQVGVRVKLYWSDDSGSPHEYGIVRDFMDKYDHLDVTELSENKGANLNFLYLLEAANLPDIDFYAFSDQDDIWETDKLIRHVNALSKFETQIACTHSTSRLQINGRHMPGRNLCQNHELRTLLAENCFQGCTMMINRLTRKTILGLPTQGITWYDWWIGTIVSIAGTTIFIEGTDTNYRLHDGNLVGIPKAKARAKRLIAKGGRDRLSQSLNLQNYSLTHGHLSEANEIQKWINGHTGKFASRLLFALTDKRRRKRMLEDIIRRLFAIRGLN
jgi:rhamnosyltransferase